MVPVLCFLCLLVPSTFAAAVFDDNRNRNSNPSQFATAAAPGQIPLDDRTGKADSSANGHFFKNTDFASILDSLKGSAGAATGRQQPSLSDLLRDVNVDSLLDGFGSSKPGKSDKSGKGGIGDLGSLLDGFDFDALKTKSAAGLGAASFQKDDGNYQQMLKLLGMTPEQLKEQARRMEERLQRAKSADGKFDWSKLFSLGLSDDDYGFEVEDLGPKTEL